LVLKDVNIVTIEKAMTSARKRQGLTQEDVSRDVNYTRSAITKYETGARAIPREMYAPVSHSIDDPEFYFNIWRETTGQVSIPFFDGEQIDHHPAAMFFLVKQETSEAVENLETVCWAKPMQSYTDEDREVLKQTIIEVLDASASMMNMVASICDVHGFSMKSLFGKWQLSLKARQFKK